jgi:DNA modification methylase
MLIKDRVRELRRVPAKDLRPNPANWRMHPPSQRNALQGALAEIGYADALLARELPDGSLMLLDGHLRAETTPDMIVPVLIVDLDDAEVAKLLLTLDPLASLATANQTQLDALLRQVQTSNEDLAKMLTDLAAENGIVPFNGTLDGAADPEPQVDKAAELQEKWKTERGQLWQIGRHRLLCGDSANAEDVQRLMQGEKAKLFATDPPYGVDYIATKSGIPRSGYATLGSDYKDIEADDFKDEKLQAFLESVFRAWLPYLERAAWYLWHAHLTQGFFSAAAAAANVVLHRQIIWVKSGFNLTRSGMYHWAHEPCFFGWVKGQQPEWYGEKNQRSVWEIQRHSGKGLHPTEKPPELWHAPIKNHTRQDEILAEPFAGSGSQFVAAEQTNRRCFGCEIEPKYAAVCLQRLADMGLEPSLAVS